MRSNFTSRCLEINVSRFSNKSLTLSISSDYSGSGRKQRLYVNEKWLAEEVERFWKSIKTKKLLSMSVSFGEIDWYDNMTNMYHTPVVVIKRGLKKARIEREEHGSIPKEWSFELLANIADTTANTPILEIVKTAIGSLFTSDLEKKLIKNLKPVLQKKENYAHIYNE